MKTTHIMANEECFRREVLESQRLVLVEFVAEWSGVSHIMAPVIERVSLRFGRRCKVCLIDYSPDNPLARAYGVTTVPTILLFKFGIVVERISGPISVTRLEAAVELALGHDCGSAAQQSMEGQ